MNNQEKLAGFIFMCNRITKPECYRFRVFGLPAGRKEVVERINRGTYLFLFDTDVKLLYGIYIATSSGKLRIEPLAFGQKFPAQVRFKIYKDCLPLPENCFKHAIQNNYQKDSNKFNPELNIRQVRSLLSLFRPLPVLSTAPTHPVMKKPSSLSLPPGNNVFHHVSRPSLFEDAYLSRMSPNQVPRKLNYKHVNELEEPDFHPPVVNVGSSRAQLFQNPHHTHQNILNLQPDSYSPMVNMGSSYAQSLPDPQHTHQNTPNLQPDFNSSVVNMGHANVMMQSHASSSLYYPYVPQQVVSAANSYQRSGAIQRVISSDQQIRMGNEYYQSSMQTEKNISTQENVVSHNLYSADAYSQPAESYVPM